MQFICILDILLFWFDSTAFASMTQTVLSAGASSLCLSEDLCSRGILSSVHMSMAVEEVGTIPPRYVVLCAPEM